jgi:streptogramin lyase
MWQALLLGFVWRANAQVPRTYSNIAERRLPDPRCDPYGIAAGPDGALWFTETIGKIGRISSLGRDRVSPANFQ